MLIKDYYIQYFRLYLLLIYLYTLSVPSYGNNLSISTATATLHYVDIPRKVFDEFCNHLEPKYKGPVKDWHECSLEYLYSTPFYADDSNVSDEVKKYLMSSIDDLSHIKRQAALYDRKLVEVIIIIN